MRRPREERTPGRMSHFEGGVTVGYLRAKILELAAREGITPRQAAKLYMEELATETGRATSADVGRGKCRVYVLEKWPAKPTK